MKDAMGNAESQGKSVSRETLEKLHRRSGAKCEGSKLGFSCSVRLIDRSDPLVHHMDGNPRNNKITNLVLLCPECHLKIIDRLSERRRKAYLEKVAEQLDLYSWQQARPKRLLHRKAKSNQLSVQQVA